MATAAALRLPIVDDDGAFDEVLRARGMGPLVRGRVTTVQVNVGKRCNMACHHCHVEAGPQRTEVMPPHVAERVLEVGFGTGSPSCFSPSM